MPQCYLHSGDALFHLVQGYKAGQTFHPESDFILEWVDLQMKGAFTSRYPYCELYLAGADHKPWGDCLSHQTAPYHQWLPVFQLKRIRLPMIPYLLQKDVKYAILVSRLGTLLDDDPWWQYDEGDATYARGLRISSLDGGDTWTVHYDDDHLFAVFGTPPAPPPPPEPPVENWAIIDIEQILTATGYKIIATTNVPCHLYFYWTTHEPQKHFRTRIERGLTVPAASQYCFVDWHKNEQDELGDTIYHTFVKEPWASCETRWFVFRAKIDNEWSPSISPIFKKHRLYVPPAEVTKYFYPHALPLTDSCDGRVRRGYIGNKLWADIHDGAGTWAQSSAETAYCDILSAWTAWAWTSINRNPILFNTDEIPAGSTINQAKLRLYFIGHLNTLHPSASLNIFQSWPISTGEIVAADYQNLAAVPLSDPKLIDDIPLTQFSTFTLNAQGRALVIPAGVTKFAMREATFDAPNIEPPLGGVRRAFIQWEDAEEPDLRPRLEVTYLPP